MAKRIATSELTDRNWDQEEEDEEAGQFVAAKKDILKQRNIIKAKRRSNVASPSSGSGGLFANFAGFSSAPLHSGGSSSSTISSSTTTTITTTPTTAVALTVANNTIKPFVDSSCNVPLKPTAAASCSKNGFTTGAAATDKCTDSGKSDGKLHIQLKKLNESVLQWMQQHVKNDPYCILTPIFKDYEKYLKTIQDESSAKSDSKDTSSTPSDTEQKTSLALENMKDEDRAKTEQKKGIVWTSFSVNKPIFSSGSSTTTSTKPINLGTTSGFSGFKFKATETQPSFSFAPSLTTSNLAMKGATTEEDDEYVPPEVEVKEIKEDGSVFSKRCKLFYEKDKNWIDKGIGNLHVKPFKDKAQLIIRADTNLGNILLNIMLLPSMQLKRQGKNNVSFVCIPNPPLTKDSGENKLVPLLLRVKTSEEADDLLAKLNTHKQGTDYQEDV